MKNKETEVTERKNKNVAITFRLLQAFFLGIFALGISNGVGDYFGYINSPIGSFSITTTIFGGMGSFITGLLAKQSEKW